MRPRRMPALVFATSLFVLTVVGGVAPASAGPRDVVVFERWNGTDHDVYRILADGTGLASVFAGPEDMEDARLSPDAAMVAATDRTDGDGDIVVANLDGTHRRRLTSSDSDDRWPAWSPDGTSLVFVRIGTPTRLMTMPVDGSERALLLDTVDAIAPVWSADGTQIGFSRLRATGVPSHPYDAEVWALASDGSTPPVRILRAPDGVYLGGWLSDGRLVVVRDKPYEMSHVGVYVVSPGGGDWTRLALARISFAHVPVVTSSELIVYTSAPPGGNDLELKLVHVDGTGHRQITRNGVEDHTVPVS